jgi:hypothetical protein
MKTDAAMAARIRIRRSRRLRSRSSIAARSSPKRSASSLYQASRYFPSWTLCCRASKP